MVVLSSTYSQTAVQFEELAFGLAARTENTDRIEAADLPTGQRNIANNLEFVQSTDSIQLQPKGSFGIMYMLKAADSVDIKVDVEWIFPKKMVDKEGNKYKSIRYTTTKPTNTELGNTFTLDEAYEMIEGKWTLNLYVDNKKLFSRSFFVYK